MPRLLLLAMEFSILFIGLPLLIYFRILPNFPIPYLLVTGIVLFFALRWDPGFPSARLFTWGNVHQQLVPLLLRNLLFLTLLGVAVRMFAPDLLFSFVKRSPALWAVVMLLYPLLSVYPQELLYRAFFFHRYTSLFGSGWGLFLASAVAFGFVHIIFGNWLSVGLCIIGGVLFSLTYHSSGSLLLTCLDHAIFGDFIFTIGLGRFFYHGSGLRF